MKKGILSLVLVLIILVSMIIPVYADNLAVTYTLDKTTATADLGSTVQVMLGVADIDESTSGINAITGKILYDENLIESVDVVSAGNNWSVAYNNTSTDQYKGNISISNMNSVKTAQSIAKLIITLKSNATVKTGTVTLQNLTTSYGSAATTPVTKTITINVAEQGGQEDDPIIIPDKPDTPTTPDTPASQDTAGQTTPAKTTNKGTATPNTSKATTLPKAGIIASGIGIAILAAIIVAIIELIKYKKIGK